MPLRPGSTRPRRVEVEHLPRVVLRSEHLGDAAEAAARDGHLLKVRRGAYVESASLDDDPHRRTREVALARILAVARQSDQPVVFSHVSAALLWGLPLLEAPPLVHVIQRSLPGGAAARDVARHTNRLRPDEVTHIAGLRVTSLVRTLVDCCRSLAPRAGLVVADSGLRSGLDEGDLVTALARAAGGRGVRRARAVLELADGGAESPGESLARAALLALGLPPPETQLRVDTAEGPYWSDMGWKEWRLLAEYDGRAKYGVAAGDPAALVREKRREDLIRDERWRLLRLTSRDVGRPSLLEARVHRVLSREMRARLTPRPFLLGGI